MNIFSCSTFIILSLFHQPILLLPIPLPQIHFDTDTTLVHESISLNLTPFRTHFETTTKLGPAMRLCNICMCTPTSSPLLSSIAQCARGQPALFAAPSSTSGRYHAAPEHGKEINSPARLPPTWITRNHVFPLPYPSLLLLKMYTFVDSTRILRTVRHCSLIKINPSP